MILACHWPCLALGRVMCAVVYGGKTWEHPEVASKVDDEKKHQTERLSVHCAIGLRRLGQNVGQR
jgi:hypothetical protein